MGNRRRSQVETSDEEESTPPSLRSTGDDNRRKRKRVILFDEVEDERETKETKTSEKKKKEQSQNGEVLSGENEEQDEVDAQPIGDVIRVSGKGKGTRKHYEAFEYDGMQYQLEDPVLLVPEENYQKPYVAIIKDVTQTWKGDMMVTGQWFYRPEEAQKKGGGSWQRRDTRELFYSFHIDEVFAESVMHKCVVHFIPQNKKIPLRKQHQGFIVQKVYDTEQMRVFNLTDKDYKDDKQHEIDLLVEKTVSRIGDLHDLENDDIVEDQMKNKSLLRKRNMAPLDVSKGDDQQSRAETPGSTAPGASEYYEILSNFKMLTGETQRDRWLEKLLLSIEFICTPIDRNEESRDQTQNSDVTFEWPDAAVPAITALEKVVHDSLSADFQKYNQKMRQLAFNLKSNGVLAWRFLNRELEPVQLLNMTPNELKEGLTTEEIASNEPEELGCMQMIDAPCKRCKEKRVGVREIIQTGRGDRYQLECDGCGNTWYSSSRDDVATTTIQVSSSATTFGIAPLATAKFEDVEKNLMSPRNANDAMKKTTEAYVPVLEANKSFDKNRAEENTTATNAE